MVLSIVGILATVLYAFSANALYKTQLRDGALQVVNDLRQARSQAQRTSQGSTVTLTSTAVDVPSAQYSTQWGAGTQTAVAQMLPNSVQVAPYSTAPINSPNTLNYSAPYSEVTATGVVWEISSPRTSSKLYVKAVGVTGKVILSATPN